jgi:hypothetical protein
LRRKVIQSDGNIQVRIYPNPLYSKTMIEFQNTESDSRVLIDIYTSTGRKVATLFNGEVEKNVAIQYRVEWRKLGRGNLLLQNCQWPPDYLQKTDSYPSNNSFHFHRVGTLQGSNPNFHKPTCE